MFQGGSPWATLIHNSMVCLGGTLLCPAASWGDFFSTMSFTFSFAAFAKDFFLLINSCLSFFHLKWSEMPNFPKYLMPY